MNKKTEKEELVARPHLKFLFVRKSVLNNDVHL